jgi:hypothetical protein
MSTSSSAVVLPTGGKISRFPMWSRIIGVILIVALAAFAAMMMGMNYIPNNLDTSLTRMSEHSSYQVSYIPELSPIPINQIQTWTLQVTDADGQPVEDAEITVEGGMPQHGHGLPTAPLVTESLGNGQYRVEGMKFHMPGWWVTTFKIARNGTTDSATFNLMLN